MWYIQEKCLTYFFTSPKVAPMCTLAHRGEADYSVSETYVEYGEIDMSKRKKRQRQKITQTKMITFECNIHKQKIL